VFEEILGIPAHPLLIHAAVVFVPLQVLAALAYAFVPFTRKYIWWAVAALIVVAPGAALLAKLSGDAFRARLERKHLASPEIFAQVDTHRSYGTMTVYFTAALSVLMLIMLLANRAASQVTFLVQPGGSAVLGVILAVLVLAGVGTTGYYIFKTGDTGAHIVWGGY
jgi:hypothetical protein